MMAFTLNREIYIEVALCPRMVALASVAPPNPPIRPNQSAAWGTSPAQAVGESPKEAKEQIFHGILCSLLYVHVMAVVLRQKESKKE